MEKDPTAKSSLERKKMRINFIDIILIVVVLIVISILGYIILSPQISIGADKENVTLQYQIEIAHLREEWKNNVEIGEKFINATTMEEIGTVVDVRCSEEKFISVNRDTGELVYTNYPDYLTMIITIETEATPSEIGYDVGKTNIQIGPNIQFRLPNLCYEGACKSIKVVEAVVNAEG